MYSKYCFVIPFVRLLLVSLLLGCDSFFSFSRFALGDIHFFFDWLVSKNLGDFVCWTLFEVNGRLFMLDDGVFAKLSLSIWNFGCAPFVVI